MKKAVEETIDRLVAEAARYCVGHWGSQRYGASRISSIKQSQNRCVYDIDPKYQAKTLQGIPVWSPRPC